MDAQDRKMVDKLESIRPTLTKKEITRLIVCRAYVLGQIRIANNHFPEAKSYCRVGITRVRTDLLKVLEGEEYPATLAELDTVRIWRQKE